MIATPKNNPSRGFTLIELLVTIAIIGILAAVIFALLTGSKSKGNDAKVKAEVGQIKTATEGYSASNGGYPYADNGTQQGNSNMWCIGNTDCKLAGNDITNNTDDWTGDKADLYPHFPNNVEFKDTADPPNTNKGYIYVSCTEPVNGVCPVGSSYIIYPQTGSERSYTVGSGNDNQCYQNCDQGGSNNGGGGGGTVTFDGGGDGHSWQNALNWNPDGVPNASNSVVIPGGVSVTGTADPIANLSVSNNGSFNLNNVLTVTGNATFDNEGVSASSMIVNGVATYNNESYNISNIQGPAIFNSGSSNSGDIIGNVTFNGALYHENNGDITGNATFNGNSVNRGNITGEATFNDTSSCTDGHIGTYCFQSSGTNSCTYDVYNCP